MTTAETAVAAGSPVAASDWQENQGVVVRGEFQGETFHATDLVVKHSEEYNVPKTQAELKDMIKSAN